MNAGCPDLSSFGSVRLLAFGDVLLDVRPPVDVAEVLKEVVCRVECATGAAAIEQDLVAEGLDDPILFGKFRGKEAVRLREVAVAYDERDVREAADGECPVDSLSKILLQFLHRRPLVWLRVLWTHNLITLREQCDRKANRD